MINLNFSFHSITGFASGNLENDAWATRYFVSKKIPLLVCQSFAKNAGLYGERVGALHVVASVTGDVEGGSKRIASQLSVLQRSEISNPPTYGARIVSYSPNTFEGGAAILIFHFL